MLIIQPQRISQRLLSQHRHYLPPHLAMMIDLAERRWIAFKSTLAVIGRLADASDMSVAAIERSTMHHSIPLPGSRLATTSHRRT